MVLDTIAATHRGLAAPPARAGHGPAAGVQKRSASNAETLGDSVRRASTATEWGTSIDIFPKSAR
jgi:hypothetical protein